MFRCQNTHSYCGNYVIFGWYTFFCRIRRIFYLSWTNIASMQKYLRSVHTFIQLKYSSHSYLNSRTVAETFTSKYSTMQLQVFFYITINIWIQAYNIWNKRPTWMDGYLYLCYILESIKYCMNKQLFIAFGSVIYKLGFEDGFFFRLLNLLN